MDITTIDAQAGTSAAYAALMDKLDMGPEIEWEPEHLASSAWLEHVPFAFWLMKVLRPSCFVELGTQGGVSYAAFCEAVDRLGLGVRCYAVDTWLGDEQAGHYDETVFQRLTELNDRRYRRFSSLLRTTFAEALGYFADGEVDLLHLDGLHTYEAICGDFRSWRPKLSDRAVVLFHDTNVRRDDFGVWRLWQELAARHPHFEFTHGHGLGIIGVGENLPAPIRGLFDATDSDDLRLAARGIFSARGAAVQRTHELRCAQNDTRDLAEEATSLRAETASLREHTVALHTRTKAAEAAAASGRAEIVALHHEMGTALASTGTLKAQIDGFVTEVMSINARFAAEHVKAQEKVIEHSAQSFQGSEAALAAAENAAAALRQQLALSEARCAALQASTCWRITAPIRAVKTVASGRPRGIATRLRRSLDARGWTNRLGREAGVATSAPVAAAVSRERILPPAAHVDLLRPRVLILAELSLAQCKKYRVDQKHDMIEALGWDCTVAAWQDTDKALSLMQTHSLVIFYRVPAFPDVVRIIQEADSLGVPHYFELDDLIFDLDDYAHNPNLLGLDPETTRVLFNGATLYRQALAQCRNVIASTPYLNERMQGVGGGSAVVIENALDNETMQAAATLRRRPPDGRIRIIYGSGTRTHNADFALIADVLKRLVMEHDNVDIVIVGELVAPPGLLEIGERLHRLPACPYREYLALLASSDIAIAPLIAGNFNDAKSNIKFLEAAVMGVPSVCSPRSAFARAIRHGTTGLLADSAEDWYRELNALIADETLRRRMGEDARKDVLARYSPDVIGRRQVAPLLSRHVPAADPRLHVLEVNVLCEPQTFGGATVVMEEMARRLNDRADTRVSIFTSAPAGWVKSYQLERGEMDGIPVFRVGVQDGAGWPEEAWDEDAAEVFRDVLRVLRPDVVHFHSMQGIGAATLQVCREEGIRYVVTLHDAWWLCERQFLVTGEGKYCGQTKINMNVCATCVRDIGVTVPRNLRLRQALDGADLLLAPSRHWRRFHVANGFSPERVVVNENGIPLPARSHPNQGPAKLRFGFVAGAEAVKGFPLLKRAFEALERPDWELVLVNHGLAMGVDSYAGVTWRVRGTVRTVPPFKTDDRDSFYDGIDVLLFPSQWPESFGLTVREALVRNKWVIATDQGGAAEAVRPGINGTLIPIGSEIGKLRRAVEDLLDRKPDLAGWVNPASDHIRDFAAQADELRAILVSVVAGQADRHADQAAD